MTTQQDLVADVVHRADADPGLLSHLTTAERPACIAVFAERMWRRVGLVVVGIVAGLCLAGLAGCGVGS